MHKATLLEDLTASEMERCHFWQLSHDLQEAIKTRAGPRLVRELVDELEVVALNTDSARLRLRCNALIKTGEPHCHTALAIFRPASTWHP